MRFRDFRRIDSSPGHGTNVPGRVHVGMVGVSTGHATELFLRRAVGFSDVPASMAGTRGVLGVDDDDTNTRHPGFVRDKGSKLIKSPTAHFRSLRLAKPCPFTDALEVFQGDSASGVFGLDNQRFGNAVVFVGAKPPFFAAKVLEFATNVFGARPSAFSASGRLLQSAAKALLTNPDRFYIGTAMTIPVAIRGKMDHAQVHADNVGRRRLCPLGQIHGYEQKPLAVLAANEIALSPGVGKAFFLILTHDESDDDTSGKRQQRHPIHVLETHQALVIGYTRKLAKAWAFCLVPLIGFAHLSHAAHGHLRGQTKALPHGAVVKFLQGNLVGRLPGKRLSRQPVSRRVEGAHRCLERLGVFWRGQKLCLQGQFHGTHYRQQQSVYQVWKRRKFCDVKLPTALLLS